jgi:putative restriction endonuclease|tara:strand:+ start:103 stop:372 length:270 start_codon:yes stop_codon:yes gene_type:complete
MFAISPTDLNWFQQLRADDLQGNVINFWTPTPWNISRLKSGDNLYFMLKSPIRKIGGYGKFVEYKNMKDKKLITKVEILKATELSKNCM